MKINEIKKTIDDYAGFDIADKYKGVGLVNLRMIFIDMCYRFSSEYVNNLIIAKYLKQKTHSNIYTMYNRLYERLETDWELEYQHQKIYHLFLEKGYIEVKNLLKYDVSNKRNVEINRYIYDKELKIKKKNRKIRYYKKRCYELQTLLNG